MRAILECCIVLLYCVHFASHSQITLARSRERLFPAFPDVPDATTCFDATRRIYTINQSRIGHYMRRARLHMRHLHQIHRRTLLYGFNEMRALLSAQARTETGAWRCEFRSTVYDIVGSLSTRHPHDVPPCPPASHRISNSTSCRARHNPECSGSSRLQGGAFTAASNLL